MILQASARRPKAEVRRVATIDSRPPEGVEGPRFAPLRAGHQRRFLPDWLREQSKAKGRPPAPFAKAMALRPASRGWCGPQPKARTRPLDAGRSSAPRPVLGCSRAIFINEGASAARRSGPVGMWSKAGSLWAIPVGKLVGGEAVHQLVHQGGPQAERSEQPVPKASSTCP